MKLFFFTAIITKWHLYLHVFMAPLEGLMDNGVSQTRPNASCLTNRCEYTRASAPKLRVKTATWFLVSTIFCVLPIFGSKPTTRKVSKIAGIKTRQSKNSDKNREMKKSERHGKFTFPKEDNGEGPALKLHIATLCSLCAACVSTSYGEMVNLCQSHYLNTWQGVSLNESTWRAVKCAALNYL